MISFIKQYGRNFKIAAAGTLTGLFIYKGLSTIDFLYNKKQAEKEYIKWNGEEYMGEVTFKNNYEKLKYINPSDMYFSPGGSTYVMIMNDKEQSYIRIVAKDWEKELHPDGTTSFFRMECANGEIFSERLDHEGNKYIPSYNGPSGWINWS